MTSRRSTNIAPGPDSCLGTVVPRTRTDPNQDRLTRKNPYPNALIGLVYLPSKLLGGSGPFTFKIGVVLGVNGKQTKTS